MALPLPLKTSVFEDCTALAISPSLLWSLAMHSSFWDLTSTSVLLQNELSYLNDSGPQLPELFLPGKAFDSPSAPYLLPSAAPGPLHPQLPVVHKQSPRDYAGSPDPNPGSQSHPDIDQYRCFICNSVAALLPVTSRPEGDQNSA